MNEKRKGEQRMKDIFKYSLVDSEGRSVGMLHDTYEAARDISDGMFTVIRYRYKVWTARAMSYPRHSRTGPNENPQDGPRIQPLPPDITTKGVYK